MSPLEARLAKIQPKLDRADKHFSDLKFALDAVRATKPYTIGTGRYPQTGQPFHYAHEFSPVPVEIGLIAADAIHNLRSALDHLAFQIVSAGQISFNTEAISFPIAKDAKAYKASTGKALIKRARPAAIQILDSIKPYDGGDPLLWPLHKLNIVDKHRLLLTVGTVKEGLDFTPPPGLSSEEIQQAWSRFTFQHDMEMFHAGPVKVLETGSILTTFPLQPELHDKVAPRLAVALVEPGIIRPQPIERIILSLGRKTFEVVERLKAFLE